MENRNTPRPGELVIAHVSKITKFGAYCKLPEYNDLDVFLPLKEVSSGWIKNIREYIHEGQKLVCEVIFYDKERNTIDISLKRVTPSKSKEKVRSYNLEKRLAVLFSQAVKQAHEQKIKDQLMQQALVEFKTFTNLAQQASSNSEEFANSKLPKKIKETWIKALEPTRKQKPKLVSYTMTLTTFNTLSGATELRELMSAIKNTGVEVKYISAPKYRLMSVGEDYATAEAKIKSAEEVIRSKLKKGVFEMEKDKLRKEKEDIMATI